MKREKESEEILQRLRVQWIRGNDQIAEVIQVKLNTLKAVYNIGGGGAENQI